MRTYTLTAAGEPISNVTIEATGTLDAMMRAADREAAFGWDLEDYSEPLCPACGEPIDYCQGHGPMGDPQGYAVLRLHDDDIHSLCHHASDCRKDN